MNFTTTLLASHALYTIDDCDAVFTDYGSDKFEWNQVRRLRHWYPEKLRTFPDERNWYECKESDTTVSEVTYQRTAGMDSSYCKWGAKLVIGIERILMKVFADVKKAAKSFQGLIKHQPVCNSSYPDLLE